MEELSASIRKAAQTAAGFEYPVLSLASVRDVSSRTGLSQFEVERTALALSIVPARYKRNIGTLGLEGQIKMLDSTIGVCGLGGLGGHIVQMLARFGTGHLIIVDGDVFSEDNLNRQALCTEEDLGRLKVEVAYEKIRSINSSTEVSFSADFLEAGDFQDLFSGADVVIDALDTVSCRLDLAADCRKMKIPLVHGAIAGNCGQVMTVFPEDAGLECVYIEGEDRGVETIEGNPPTTPALIAALQVQEAVKIICGGDLLRNGFLLVDTASNLYQFIRLT
jgi:molybdopterin/thiamine biosynthesis adenylyltransferase